MSEHAVSLPMFWAHGSQDTLVAFDALGLESKRILKSHLGIKDLVGEASPGKPGLCVHCYEGMGHSVCREELEDLNNWLTKVMPNV